MPDLNFHIKQQPAAGSTGLSGGVHGMGTMWTPRTDSNAQYLKIAYSGLSEHGYRNVASLINKTNTASPIFSLDSTNEPIFNQSVKKWSHYDSSLELGVRTTGRSAWFSSGSLPAFGNSNYTLETWVYIPTFATVQDPNNDDPTLALFFHTNGSNQGFKILITGTNFGGNPDKGLYFTAPPSGTATAYTSSNVFSTNTWHHIAVVRNGNSNSNLKMYIDGINRTSFYAGTVNQNWNYSGNFTCTAPQDAGNLNAWNTTKIQDYRVYQGVAKYTSNFSGSLPESMFIKN